MADANSQSNSQPAAPFRVLVADDNPQHTGVMRKILGKSGYEVKEVHTGEVALLEFESWRPNLVILDCMLPQKCGLECLEHIRNHPRAAEVRVVMCSAKTDIDYVLTCLESGADGFIFKPFEAHRFSRRIENILSGGKDEGEG